VDENENKNAQIFTCTLLMQLFTYLLITLISDSYIYRILWVQNADKLT